MIPYILYSALILTACLVFYKLLLQKETFFHLNRFVLLSCMALAFILPLVPVPQQLSFRKIAVEKPVVVAKTSVKANITPAIKEQPVQPTLIEETQQVINVESVTRVLVYLYWFGVIVFALNFLMQAIILLYRAYSTSVIQDGKFRIVEITGDKAPCSFANNIFINPEKYEWETYNQILLHEKIHIEQKHTIDLLLAEIVLIFQWFNPFAWQWRKTLEINLEFLTDDQMLQQDVVEKESYQFSLLKVAAPQFPLSLTTNYNQSLLKKRIIMMNSKKSNVHTTWKYFFLVPIMVLFACLFNQPAAQSQTLASKEKEEKQSNIQGGMETEGSWFATIKGETVHIQFKSDENNSNSTFQLNEFKDLPKDKQGTFTLTREAGTMTFTGKFEGNSGMGTYKFTANKEYRTAMSKEGIDLEDDEDFMVFFMINVKQSYVQMLKKKGYNNLDKDELIPLAALDVNEAYITSIKQVIPDIDLDDLVPFKSLGIDKAYIEEIRKSGYKDLSPGNIIALKSQGIDAKYIKDFHSSTNSKKNNKDADDEEDKEDDVIAFKSLGIDQAFIDSYKKIGYNDLSNHDLMALKSLNVTPEYINSFEKAGYKNITTDDLFALKSLNVTPELILQYKDLGFNNLNLEDVVGAKAVGATPSFIKSMKGKGHDFKSLDKYISLKAVLGN
ncbi:M56 family metallopeptidase [Flavobacterium saccharophilum]|uniref:Signal transducer regulating beta-lactamase production, contains metallopeptidase domain n=1 Tax=Flavobacterium saccharophilum TaxID=29534 RepID=A0A1M7DB87_9FLAO|nr:M56 family metallopeptidase [Flavobacterium saccharophilum]SHL76766.1 Signal transducer regulating beta-lactamase production, contains metallopeptidase domain [Flavobacterium saccharophilum]